MAEAMGRKGGQKNRKFGRAARRPGHAAYKAQNRRDKNKARSIARIMKKFEKYQPCNVRASVCAILTGMGFKLSKTAKA